MEIDVRSRLIDLLIKSLIEIEQNATGQGEMRQQLELGDSIHNQAHLLVLRTGLEILAGRFVSVDVTDNVAVSAPPVRGTSWCFHQRRSAGCSASFEPVDCSGDGIDSAVELDAASRAYISPRVHANTCSSAQS